MNEKARTHEQRAEEAWRLTLVHSPFADEADAIAIIAEETRPDELLRAAQAALDCPERSPGLCPDCRARLRAARALYEETP